MMTHPREAFKAMMAVAGPLSRNVGGYAVRAA